MKWLPKPKILGPADDRQPNFFEQCTDWKQSYCFIKRHWSVKISWICSFIQLTKPFAVQKACTRWETKRGIGIIFPVTWFFRKTHTFKTTILLYQSSLEHKNVMKLKKLRLFYLVIKWTKSSLYQGLVGDGKLGEASVCDLIFSKNALI